MMMSLGGFFGFGISFSLRANSRLARLSPLPMSVSTSSMVGRWRDISFWFTHRVKICDSYQQRTEWGEVISAYTAVSKAGGRTPRLPPLCCVTAEWGDAKSRFNAAMGPWRRDRRHRRDEAHLLLKNLPVPEDWPLVRHDAELWTKGRVTHEALHRWLQWLLLSFVLGGDGRMRGARAAEMAAGLTSPPDSSKTPSIPASAAQHPRPRVSVSGCSGHAESCAGTGEVRIAPLLLCGSGSGR